MKTLHTTSEPLPACDGSAFRPIAWQEAERGNYLTMTIQFQPFAPLTRKTNSRDDLRP